MRPESAGCYAPRERLSDHTFAKTWNSVTAEDPSAQILSAWIAKEEPRTLLSTAQVGGDAHLTPTGTDSSPDVRLTDPELLTLAIAIDTRWPEINASITTGTTNAGTKG